MDFDLEIISEEGDCPDPLFNSIMTAMNSMKEATADKIYQKIQKEGETNYSKPQVDRALASALKYGIFEVRNKRYRVRDDILDDEDTVYWKLKNSREESPFLPDEGLNPERDNLRFKKVTIQDRQECPQCGRTKKPSNKLDKIKEKPRKKEKKAKPIKRQRKTRETKKKEETRREYVSSRKVQPKRKTRVDSLSEERQTKMRKISGLQASGGMPTGEHLYFKDDLPVPSPRDKRYDGGMTPGKFDTTDESDADSISSPSDDEQSFTDYQDKKKVRKRGNSDYVPQCFRDSVEGEMTQGKISSVSFQSESDSEKSDGTFSSHKDTVPFMENLPCTSRSAGTKGPTSRNQYMDSSELYGKPYGREEVDSTDRKSDWMGYADQPQGNIIESNNVLTIEPMDSMGFKSQEQASYIS